MSYGKWPWEVEQVPAVRYRKLLWAVLDDIEYNARPKGDEEVEDG